MTDLFQKISMIGLGYIGLPTAAVMASRRVTVVGVDVNPRVVETINRGDIHIVEPELDIIVKSAVNQGYLRATREAEQADAFLIAVPTPFKGDHEPDLAYVQSAANLISPVLKRGDLVILESTSPVGTTEQLSLWLAEARPDLRFPHSDGEAADVNIAYCPERVLPGKVVHELVSNDRIIGGMTQRCSNRAISLYRIFVEGECITTNARTAEMCKLTENSFRDVNIAFANELSLICDKLDINVWELIRLANHHPRVNILQPGTGVGGHCIAVDPWFIVSRSPDEAKLIAAARRINDYKPVYVFEKVMAAARQKSAPIIACFGLAFKPDIDDLRESPAMEVVRMICASGFGKVLAIEPHIDELPSMLADTGAELARVEQALADADVVVMLVNHKAFQGIPAARLEGKVVIDACGVWK